MAQTNKIEIIGAGLAGAEAAWQLAKRSVRVVIREMRPQKFSPAHKTSKAAELVCSNSLRSDDATNSAVGLLHQEMRLAGSLILEAADATKVPAGGALAVDREGFSAYIDAKLKNHQLISFEEGEAVSLPPENTPTIIASGPLTSEALIQAILAETKGQSLNFFDAIAPVVYKDSIDMAKAWYQSRYDKGDKFDYINCPLTKEEYESFVDALLSAEKVEFHDFEKACYFDGCLPVEVMAERGRDTLMFGPMKPVGLTNPHNPSVKPYAVVQLRQDNKDATIYNIVGFQTNLKFGEQKRVFSMIPGLENANFVKYGVMHKNTYINSTKILDNTYNMKDNNNIYFAGQITGVEGYVESISSGLLAGINAANQVINKTKAIMPKETVIGALADYISTENDEFQPMNANFGILPELEEKIKDKKLRYTEFANRSLKLLKNSEITQ